MGQRKTVPKVLTVDRSLVTIGDRGCVSVEVGGLGCLLQSFVQELRSGGLAATSGQLSLHSLVDPSHFIVGWLSRLDLA